MHCRFSEQYKKKKVQAIIPDLKETQMSCSKMSSPSPFAGLLRLLGLNVEGFATEEAAEDRDLKL